MELSNSQKEAEVHLLKFIFNIDRSNNLFLLTGSAGTGKSTLISHILNDIKFNKKKIVFSATTNKAVSILEKMGTEKFKEREVVYLTIQKLLNIRRKIDKDGNELFQPDQNIKKAKSIFNYDIIVIDESSMINQEMMNEIFKLRNRIKGKIIFLGDRAQLPPVNEIQSSVFNQDIPKYELLEIMRYKGNLVLLANKFRDLVFNRDLKLKFKEYKDKNIKTFKNYDKWISSYSKKLEKHLEKENFNFENIPIFLVYTNQVCAKINQDVRNILFSGCDNKYNIGEVIIFNNYYYHFPTETKYYTSQKMQIKGIEKKKYNWDNFILKLLEQLDTIFAKFLIKNTDCNVDMDIFKKFIFSKLDDVFKDIQEVDVQYYDIIVQNEKNIFVLSDKSKQQFNSIVELVKNNVKKFKKYILKRYKDFEEIKILIDALMLNIWEFFYLNVLDTFADISYGYCITTHKSQGSTFNNVYIHLNNIIKKNSNREESYRCLYTAITRTSKKINILLED